MGNPYGVAHRSVGTPPCTDSAGAVGAIVGEMSGEPDPIAIAQGPSDVFATSTGSSRSLRR
jgi:hypothetical protein